MNCDAMLLPLPTSVGHTVYPLFIKMDYVKYGFFMRLDTYGMV
jgi:hypothetical protein